MSSNTWGLEAGTATKLRDMFAQVDGLVGGYVVRTKLTGRSLKRELNERGAKAQQFHLPHIGMPISHQHSLGYTGRTADDCDWSLGSKCQNPAPYEVRERHSTSRLCIGHLAEHRMAVHGFGPALRQERARPQSIKS